MEQPPDLRPDGVYRQETLDGARCARADLDGVTIEACSMIGIDLRNARLNGAVVRDSDLTGARLAGANLFGARFERCKFLGVDLHDGVTMTAASFDGCTFDYASFRGVRLDGMTFERCSFVEADLSLTSLRRTTFSACDLTRVDLIETAFFQTDVRGSNLTGWHLRRDRLDGIVVTSAQLRELAEEIGISVVDPSTW